jgi:predicted O-methyltransferase YrrM
MPNFTSDWITPKTLPWTEHVVPRLRNKPNAWWLEVGSYEGRSALWVLENALGPGSKVVCIDIFDSDLAYIDLWGVRGYEQRFEENTRDNPGIVARKGRSSDILLAMQAEPTRFDGAYVDGDHREEALSRDLELVWPLLLPGAVLVCDDYGLEKIPEARATIDKFLARVEHQVLHVDFQILVLKE